MGRKDLCMSVSNVRQGKSQMETKLPVNYALLGLRGSVDYVHSVWTEPSQIRAYTYAFRVVPAMPVSLEPASCASPAQSQSQA